MQYHYKYTESSLPFKRLDEENDIVKVDRVTEVFGEQYRVITKAFTFYVDTPNSDVFVMVPKNYIFDGASTPSWLQWVFPPYGNHSAAAAVHDILCEEFAVHKSNGSLPYTSHPITRHEVNRIFKQALKASGTSWLKQQAGYWGTRIYFFLTGYTRPRNHRMIRDKAQIMHELNQKT